MFYLHIIMLMYVLCIIGTYIIYFQYELVDIHLENVGIIWGTILQKEERIWCSLGIFNLTFPKKTKDPNFISYEKVNLNVELTFESFDLREVREGENVPISDMIYYRVFKKNWGCFCHDPLKLCQHLSIFVC